VSNSDVITGEAPKRYAQALVELAEEAKSMKKVEKDVLVLKGLFAKSDDLSRMAASPIVALDDKVAALTAVAKKAKVSPLTTQFIGTVAQNRRASEIPAMLASFQDIVARRKGSILTCSVASSCVSGLDFTIALSRPNLRILK